MTEVLQEVTSKFVEFIPKHLELGTLYISGEYTTTAHLCACGCGEKVVLPLHPTDWRMKFDGKAITIRPSVGNWSFPCKSHYLITENRIEWAGQWSDEQIAKGRGRDADRKNKWQEQHQIQPKSPDPENDPSRKDQTWIQKLLKRLFG